MHELVRLDTVADMIYMTLTCYRLTNFIIVEVTPIGIDDIGWRFWIVWTIFNAVFLPVIYFFYPETANRTLEDLDDYYRSNPALIVTKDPDAISIARPQKFIDREEREIRQNQARNSDVQSVLDADFPSKDA